VRPHPATNADRPDPPGHDHAGATHLRAPQRTYFHLPGAPPIMPWAQEPMPAAAHSVPGWLALPVGSTVTLHGREPQYYRVIGVYFHEGPPPQPAGLHLMLEEAPPPPGA